MAHGSRSDESEYEKDLDLEKVESDRPQSHDDEEIEQPIQNLTVTPLAPTAAHLKSDQVLDSTDEIAETESRDRSGSRNNSQATRSSFDSQRTASDADAHVHDPAITHSASRTRDQSRSRAQSSTRSIPREAVKVPVSQRRGLFARFALIPEIEDAKNYPRRSKWIITTIVAIAGAGSPMGSSIVLPALPDIARSYNTQLTVVNLSVAMYLLSMSIFPLWWSSFSETLGRRTIYIVSFALFALFNVLAGVSPTVGMFLVMRVLSGGAAASVQAVGAGTVADVWEVKERGKAMGMFYLGPLCGPLLSPVIGGLLATNLGWRSAQYFLAVFGGALWIMIFFCLPETLKRRRPLAAEAEQEAVAEEGLVNDKGEPLPTSLVRTTTTATKVKITARKYLGMARRAFIDPLRIILLLQFPPVALSVLYSSICLGSLYVLNISVTELFSGAPYHYNSTIVGLLYLPNSAGYFISSVLGGRWVDYIMHREARRAGRYDEKGRLQFRPEDRMKENAWLGCVIFPLALIAYGWFAQYHLNVAFAMVANFFFGLGSMIIFGVTTTMLTEYMPRKSSNGVAVNNFVRMVVSAIGSIVAEPLIKAIGNGWLFTGLGVISLAGGSGVIFSMMKFGDHWRVKMDARLDRVMGD